MGTTPWTFLAENLAEVSCKSIQSHCFQHISVVFMHFYGQGVRSFYNFDFSGRRNYIADMEDKRYETPEIEVLEIDAEGVLCASNEILDENEGEW